ncbi:MAG: response regulator, partial [Nitrospira sp.]|nr:response regulator [Nitrospira sp.]
MNILIVDDIEINRKLLRVTLQVEGHHTLEAADGVEALQVLERERIDAIISDILMPNMDGYRLCYEVRKNERLKATPFIVYSSTYTSPSDEKLALELAADKFIRKPASTKVILDALEEVIAKRELSPSRSVELPEELEVLKLYSERLVRKLEEKNAELERQTEELRESQEQLQIRAYQQSILAELGQYALAATNLSMLLNEAILAVAQTLKVEYSKVLELLPDGQALLLRAGV